MATISVLLDAGAGSRWRYRGAATGHKVSRSEGLALASLRMFEAGLFSDDANDPLRADASRLAALTAADLARGLTVTETNPLTGFEARAALLSRLGRTLMENPRIFARGDRARPGGLFDHLTAVAGNKRIKAPAILHELLTALGPIWQNRLTIGNLPLGDTWHHSAIKRADATNAMMPLHKLSQWLTYSLVEPVQRAGIAVADIDGLTGLAEYRNGGLLLDSGVVVLRERDRAQESQAIDSELVVEWRALTVALLDRLLPLLREQFGLTPGRFPLGAMLQGGTWAAGRKLARQLRRDGSPPLVVTGDGTVF